MKKLKSKKGFSLTEVLVAVLIMAMITGVVATGMPTAINCYHTVVKTANAQMLLTTTTNALRNELDLARNVSVDKSTEGTINTIKINYVGTTGTDSYITFKTGYAVRVQEYIGYKDKDDKGVERLLVSTAAASTTMRVEVSDVEVKNGCVYFTGLTVKNGTSTLVQSSDFVVKLMN